MILDLENLQNVLTKPPTFQTLIQPVVWAEDEAEADAAPWPMKKNTGASDRSASLLAVINGVLVSTVGIVLVAHVDDDTDVLKCWEVRVAPAGMERGGDEA